MSVMYALVMWIGDEPTTSVVPWTEVEVIGKKTRAKWGPTYWPVQLLRRSEDKRWLESLSVIANGEVLWSRSADLNSTISKKRKLGSGDDKNDDDFGDLDAVEQPAASPQASNHADEKSTVTDLDDSDKGEDSSTDSDSSTEKNKETKNKSSQTQSHQECNDFPKITPEILEFMDSLVTLLKSQLPEGNKYSTPVGTATVIPSRRKTELIPESGIFICNTDLCDITKKWSKRPKEMVRRLMRTILKKEALKKMSPTGKGSHEPIPKHIFLAVETYVNQNINSGLELSRTEYTRCLTLMCNTLRHPKPTSSKSAQRPPDSERTTRFVRIIEQESDSSVDDRKKTRHVKKEAARFSMNESRAMKEKKIKC